MQKLTAILGLLAALCGVPAAAQTQFPATLPASTVWGRTGIGAGPGQAIPFSALAPNLFGATLAPQHSALIGEGTSPFNGAAPGAAGTVLESNGASADPSFQTLTTPFVNFTQAGTGTVLQTLDVWAKSQPLHLKDFGAKSDGVLISSGTASITSGTGALTVSAATFTSNDVGKPIRVDGAGATNSQYFGTITAFTSSTQVTVSPNAGTTLSSAALSNTQQVAYGTDNATAMQNWVNQCQSSLQICLLDGGFYAFGSGISIGSGNLFILGQGRQSSILLPLNPSTSEFSINTNNPIRMQSFAMWSSQVTGITNNMVFLTGPAQNYGSVFEDLYFVGGNTDIQCGNCQNVHINKVTFIGAIGSGVVLQNTNSTLSGGWFISDSEITLTQTASTRQTCITMNGSGGNMSIVGSMIHFCNSAIILKAGPAGLGDVFINGNSIEQNDSGGIVFQIGSGSVVQTVQIIGNDIAGGTPNGIQVQGTTAYIQELEIVGNSIYPNGGTGIAITNGASLGGGDVTIVGNTLATGGGTTTGINISGNAVAGIAVGNSFRGLTTDVLNSSPKFYAEDLMNGHVRNVGVAPTANTCAGFAAGTGSTDIAGRITYTSATTCSITWAQSLGAAPFCWVTPETAASTVQAVPSTTGLAVTFGTAQTSFSYGCKGL